MKKTDELLQIIEGGDPTKILSEDDLVQRLNFLLKHKLINITEDKIRLTEKGKDARTKGIQKIIEEKDFNKELLEFSNNEKKGRNLWKIIFRRLKKNNLKKD